MQKPSGATGLYIRTIVKKLVYFYFCEQTYAVKYFN